MMGPDVCTYCVFVAYVPGPTIGFKLFLVDLSEAYLTFPPTAILTLVVSDLKIP